MFDKTFDTIVDIIFWIYWFCDIQIIANKKEEEKKIMTNLYARYLYNILQQFITDTYIYHNISLTPICILCALITTC